MALQAEICFLLYSQKAEVACDEPGIEVVKCNVWEDAIHRSIFSIRKMELKVLWRSFVLSAFNTFLMSSIPAIVSVATFYIYIIITDKDLSPRIAFTSLTLFAVLRTPLFQVRWGTYALHSVLGLLCQSP